MSHFVEDGGEQVVFACGFSCGGSVGCVGEGGGEFAVVVGGGVYEPADAVGIMVDEDCVAVGATLGVVGGDLGFG
ncbi:hypothetical protein NIES19_00930 [Anabaena cylindrica PCC 7122]|nr:hypothetical protein NIES19_00930 [Anabaena cylindrica PCC 7122]